MAMINGSKAPMVTDKQFNKARKDYLKAVGRPSKYSAAVSNELLTRIEAGETLRSICRLPGMPHISVVYDWEAALPEFAERLARARKRSAHSLVDDAVDIIDSSASSKNLVEVRSCEMRAKTRLEVAKAHNREYYGDKVQVNQNLTIETMEQQIARLTGQIVTIPAEFRHVIK